MTNYQKESHTRSLLKGISWRVVASTDTILVVLLVTWFNGNPSIGDALKIGLFEFLIKLAVYYVHERVWERVRIGDGLDKARTFKKAISWRIIATTMTFVIAGYLLDSFDHIALAIAAIEFFSKFILYYVHERIWLKLPLGRVRGWMAHETLAPEDAVADSSVDNAKNQLD
jgi:uncharacterized membrane protein